MLEARKANKVYRITEEEVETFRLKGYDIYENGVLQKHAEGKSVPVEVYEAALAEIKELEAKLGKKAKKAKKDE